MSLEGKLDQIRSRALTGDLESQVQLGCKYYEGEDTPVDYKMAAYWFQRAARKGDRWAQYCLGTLYFCGEGVPQCFELVLKWVRKSAVQGLIDAQILLGYMYQHGIGTRKRPREAVRNAGLGVFSFEKE